MKTIMDNFSSGAADYAIYRPGSPPEVFDFLYNNVPALNAAWDCGTGNGQVAVKLSEKFKTVYATDISAGQLDHAQKRENIIYRQERAEQTSFADHSLDLVTVAQAIHWFDFEGFYAEVRRVARPGALIAAWTYNLLKLTPAINEVIGHFYYDITHPYWDKERYLVDDGYSTIPFPFDEIQAPAFKIIKQYTFDQLIGYLRTWSGVRHYIEKEGADPTLLVYDDLKTAWGGKSTHEVYWPVFMRAGKVR